MALTGDVLLPTAYFPPVAYFANLVQRDNIWIEQMETFPKQTFRNRCEIMTEAGKATLVVPVTRPQGNHTMTKDIEICYREPWLQQHWKALQSGYSSSPFFSYYADIIQPLFESKETLLAKHNQDILETMLHLLGIKMSVEFTKDFEKKPEVLHDLRSEFSKKKSPYLIGFPSYPQVFGHKHGFMQNLSILDLLFNTGPDSRSYLEGITRLIKRKS
jgi:hypothetical protein